MQATQEEIFDTVAKQMIDTFLDGYNGTIFAYGQTSSGKTHTIEGSGRKFVDRGLIPRTLSYIYKEIERRGSEEEMTVHISYMEIYQDTGYDLLNPGMRPGALMVEVPKVRA
jgi:kinesin family protein 6/9